jgi:hypothetical protein
MATTRAVLLPFAAEFPASNFPSLTIVNRRPALAFDASTDETCYWTLIAPQGLTGTMTLVVTYIMASANTANVVFQAQVEAVTDADATDLDAGTSFDTANNSGQSAVPATAGYIKQVSITLTNQDSVAAADLVRISLNRDADRTSATDDATGDCYVLGCELRDAA